MRLELDDSICSVMDYFEIFFKTDVDVQTCSGNAGLQI